jgi:molybdenum cofactor cytidylyltransferase
MKLSTAFNIQQGDVVALVGAGGKTSTLVALGHELAGAGLRVLATTTTRIGEPQLALMPRAMRPQTQAALTDALNQDGFVFVYDEIAAGKVYGPSPTIVSWLLDSMDADVLLIEADGARGLPFKAPHPHEPVIPPETTLVVPIVALTALGQPLDEQHVYNPEAMIERYGFYYGSPVKSPWIAQVLRDEALGLKDVPERARVLAFINATPPTGYLRGRARLIARLVLRSPRLSGVALGDTSLIDPIHEVQRPIGAVVLAAGMSRRMGEPKVLLPWSKGRTIIEHILEQLIMTRVDHIVVVTGNRADEVGALAQKLDVQTVYNPDFANAEMLSSLKAGLRAMPDHVGAALVVLGDQPSIQPRIIHQVIQRYAEGAGDIVAPSYNMRRGHPILIDRRYWREILALPDNGAPRDVINAHADRIAYVEVDSDSVLRDVDTPEEYREARARLRPDQS